MQKRTQKFRAVHCPRSARIILPIFGPLLAKVAGLIWLIRVTQKANCHSRWNACFLPSLVMQISMFCRKMTISSFLFISKWKGAGSRDLQSHILFMHRTVRAASYIVSLAHSPSTLHTRPRACGKRLSLSTSDKVPIAAPTFSCVC